MKIEKNNVFFFGIFVNIKVLMALRLSFQHETKCIRDIVPLISNQHEARAVMNCHVFARPRSMSHKFWWFLFVPAALSVWDLWVNVGLSSIVSGLFAHDTGMITKFYISQSALTVLLCIVSWLCFSAARSLDQELGGVAAMEPNGG